jgi:hypothetical protein
MSTFPNSPRVQKGVLYGIDPSRPGTGAIVFQYNPDTLTRTLRAQTAGAQGGDRVEALRLKAPPEETIRLEVEIDATDQLETLQGPAAAAGLHPTLAALEMLVYPKSAAVIANNVLAAAGIIEVIPVEAPLAVFVWGGNRVVPVRVTSFTITEEAFDPSLNPIRAKVSLELRVLSYNDLGLDSAGGAMFLAHQMAKEALAVAGAVASASAGLSPGGAGIAGVGTLSIRPADTRPSRSRRSR